MARNREEAAGITWWPLLCWWWCLCSLNPATGLQNETDRLALMSFKNSINQDPFQVFRSWNDSRHFCLWRGVSCSRSHPDRVTALNLNSQLLVGSLSPHIGNLSFIRYMDLQNNSFHGQIPQEIGGLRRLQHIELSNNSFRGNIPSNLSRCSNLHHLGLAKNKLMGSIPMELGFLPKLRLLDLTENALTGRIPYSIGNLSSLHAISVLSNDLKGQIPEQLSQLRSLRLLRLSENSLTGEVPSSLYNMSSIEVFEVDFNKLQGRIPSEIGNTLPKIASLIFEFNSFTGLIPSTLSNASTLHQVTFISNNFTGLIPKDLGKLQQLQFIDFSRNRLQDDLSFIVALANCSNLEVIGAASNFLRGSIPTSVANLSKHMLYIDLSNSQLHGTIPMGIENLSNLQFLELHTNHLSGPIHINFQKFQKLQYLALHKNKFTGTIPSSFGNSTLLSHILLGFNHFSGGIPPSLGGCRNLIHLDLSHNNLTGSITQELVSLASLSLSLDLAGNSLTGPIPSQVGLLQNLVHMDLSDNRLSEVIPSTISKCLSLEELHLQGNSFGGEIPQILGDLQGLQVLDLSSNNFSGQIPISLAKLDGLNYLNLSFNSLHGEVPKLGIFLNASVVSLLGNNGLCGGITGFKLPSCPLSHSNKYHLPVALKIIIPMIVTICFALLVGSLVFWHRKRTSSQKNISMPSLQYQFLRISYADLFKATDGFSVANIIGVGSYGSVYKGFLEQLGLQVAIKVLNLKRRGASNSFVSECQALGSIRHRNLLMLLSVCSSIDFQGNDFKALIYKFMVNGNLEQRLHGHNAEDGQERESRSLKLIGKLNIAIDIATAIEYLHNGSSSTIIHGDLKPSNVLLDENMTAYIGDFGLAKIVSTISGEIQQYQSSSTAIKGSIGYVAPEYGLGGRVSVKGDVYSYGILLLEMFTGMKPTDDSLKDDLNLHTFVETSLPYKIMDIVYPKYNLSEDEGESSKECILSILRIGIACSMEQPEERIEMRDVVNQLQEIKGSYMEKLKQKQRNT